MKARNIKFYHTREINKKKPLPSATRMSQTVGGIVTKGIKPDNMLER